MSGSQKALREAAAIAFLWAMDINFYSTALHFTRNNAFCWATVKDPLGLRPELWILEFLAGHQPELKRLLMQRSRPLEGRSK